MYRVQQEYTAIDFKLIGHFLFFSFFFFFVNTHTQGERFPTLGLILGLGYLP